MKSAEINVHIGTTIYTVKHGRRERSIMNGWKSPSLARRGHDRRGHRQGVAGMAGNVLPPLAPHMGEIHRQRRRHGQRIRGSATEDDGPQFVASLMRSPGWECSLTRPTPRRSKQ